MFIATRSARASRADSSGERARPRVACPMSASSSIRIRVSTRSGDQWHCAAEAIGSADAHKVGDQLRRACPGTTSWHAARSMGLHLTRQGLCKQAPCIARSSRPGPTPDEASSSAAAGTETQAHVSVGLTPRRRAHGADGDSRDRRAPPPTCVPTPLSSCVQLTTRCLLGAGMRYIFSQFFGGSSGFFIAFFFGGTRSLQA